jgi:hypothetical protein
LFDLATGDVKHVTYFIDAVVRHHGVKGKRFRLAAIQLRESLGQIIPQESSR